MTAYEQAAGILAAALTRGDIPWERQGLLAEEAPRNLISGKAYSGLNLLLLPPGGAYLTPSQAQEAGLPGSDGAPRHTAVFCKRVSREGAAGDFGLCRTYELLDARDLTGQGAGKLSLRRRSGDAVRRAYTAVTGEDPGRGADMRKLVTRAMTTGLDPSDPGAELCAEIAGAMTCVALGLTPERRQEAQLQYGRRWSRIVSENPKSLLKAARHAEDSARAFLAESGERI